MAARMLIGAFKGIRLSSMVYFDLRVISTNAGKHRHMLSTV